MEGERKGRMKGQVKPLQHERASDLYRQGFGPTESYNKLQSEFEDVALFETFRTWWKVFRKNYPRGGLLDQAFSWENMDEGGIDLPWEASRQIFDLLLVLEHDRGVQPRPVLTFRIARWYWRVCLATPDLDLRNHTSDNEYARDYLVRHRLIFAQMMAALEIKQQLTGTQSDFWPVVWRLVCEPWRFQRDKNLYDSEIKSGQIPDFNTVMDEFNRDGSISNAFHAEYEKQLMLNTVVTDDEHPSMDGHRKGRQWRA